MIKLNYILLLILIFSSLNCKNQSDRKYPELVEKYSLEQLHDKAKWEIYKLNCIGLTDNEVDYLVNFELPKSLLDKFVEFDWELRKNNKSLKKERKAIEQILGDANVIDFLDVELELIEKDSSSIFKNGEIFLSFFPKDEIGKRWSKPTGGLYYTIVLKDNEVIRHGRDDYVEFDYPLKYQKYDNKVFIELLKKRENLNPWLNWYLESKKFEIRQD